MSLTTATRPAPGRAGSPTYRSGGRPPGGPRLQIVRDDHRAAAPVQRRTARPVSGYRSDLSVRSGRAVSASRAVVSGRPARPERVTAPVRLTRRGRIVVRVGGATLTVLTLLAGVLLIDRTAEAGSTSRPVPVTYRVVLPGETLWQIAGEVAPNVDRRDTVARIVELNALSSAGVNAGQRIAVPIVTP